MNPASLTIGQIALEHYLPAKRSRRRTNTVDGYESSIRLHVLPLGGRDHRGHRP